MRITFFPVLFLLIFSSCSSLVAQKNVPGEETVLEKEKSSLYFSIARSYEQNRRYEDAIENYQEAISLDKSNYPAHFYYGRLLLKRNFIKEGLERLEFAVQDPKGFTEARNFLASYKFEKLKDLSGAKKLIDLSAKDLTYRDQEQTWALKLKIDNELSDANEKRDSLLKVLALQPKVCKSRLDITSTLYKMSHYSQALRSARYASKLCLDEESKNQAAFIKGLIFIKKNNPLVAEKILNNIKPHSNSFKNMLNRVQTVVRKKINSGI